MAAQLTAEQRESLLTAARAWLQVVAELAPLYTVTAVLLDLLNGMRPLPRKTGQAVWLVRRTLAIQRELNDTVRTVEQTPLGSPLPPSVVELIDVLKLRRLQLGQACLGASLDLRKERDHGSHLAALAAYAAYGLLGAMAYQAEYYENLPPTPQIDRMEAAARARATSLIA